MGDKRISFSSFSAAAIILVGAAALIMTFLWTWGQLFGSPKYSGSYTMFIGERPGGTGPSSATPQNSLTWSDYPFRLDNTKPVEVGGQSNARLGNRHPVHWYRVNLEAQKLYFVDLAIDEDESADADDNVDDKPRLGAVWDLRGNRVPNLTEVLNANRPMLKRGENVTVESETKRVVQRLIVVPEMDGIHFIPVGRSEKFTSEMTWPPSNKSRKE